MPSKTQIVMDDIRTRIHSGEYPPGSKLPSAREMREQYGVSQMTVRMAIERLKAEGWVVTTPGSGVYVAEVGRSDDTDQGGPSPHSSR